MPIITIECVVSAAENKYPAEIIRRLADELGRLLGSKPAGAWLKMRYLDDMQYAENESDVDPAVRPTFVEVLKHSLGNQESLAAESRKIASTVSETLDRPRENVHVIFLPEGAGRVAFGGELVRTQGKNEGRA
jgi:phenylpyruvate tautomerase PptA (4-oxalocrotonate tautomerase family)